VYLFDARLIESNLFLQAANNPHGSDYAQPIDALHTLDKYKPLEYLPKDSQARPFIPQSYFECLKDIKSSLTSKQQNLEQLRATIKLNLQHKEEKEAEERLFPPTLYV